jgi:hypothetical protein
MKIKDTKEFEECMQPSVNMCINQVGNQLARAQKSTTFCMEMSDVSAQDACKFGVIMASVADNKDPKLCDSLPESYKKNCLMSIVLQDAMTSGDLTKCDGLSSLVETTGPSIDIGTDRVEQCKSNIIIQKQDAKVADCDKLKK